MHGGVDKVVFKKLMPDHYTDQDLVKVGEQKDQLFCRKAKEIGLPHIDGLGPVLKYAKETGIKCIAVTNAPRGAAELVLQDIRDKFEAGDVIKGLVVGAECPKAKPHPDPYLIGMKKLGVKAEDCLVFEDSPSGCKAGKAAEVAAVVGLRTELPEWTLKAAGATVTVADWTEARTRARVAAPRLPRRLPPRGTSERR